jgi:thiol-disulfide isomerase/thioredoxin
MKKRNILFVLMIVTVLASPPPAACGTMPEVGKRLVAMRLPPPATDSHRAYLGLAGDGNFDPLSISGHLLLIEIFSMYCPHCQREAPDVNRLYEAIQASPDLRNRVKMVGIGVGNSEFEVNHFRNHYKVPFPLFPDEEFIIHRDLGEVRTPYFIIVAVDPPRSGTILWTGAGKLGSVEEMTARLSRLMDRKEAQ